MNIVELLKLRGLDTKESTKMIRHTDHEDYRVSKMTKEHLEVYHNTKVNRFLVAAIMLCLFLGLKELKPSSSVCIKSKMKSGQSVNICQKTTLISNCGRH